MSVLIPDLQVYNYLQAAIEKLAYTTVIEEFWSDSVKNHFRNCPDIEAEAERLILSWLKMNQDSYSKRYNETSEETERTNLIPFYHSTYTHKPLKALQALKYLQCVDYNIEIKPEEEQSSKDLQLLRNCINDLSSSIIGQLEEYKAASYSN